MGRSSLKVNTKVWDALMKRVSDLHGLVAKTGVQGDKAAQQHADGSSLTNVEIAAIHEFNEPTDTPPGRPWIRPIYDLNPDKWKGKLAEAATNVLGGANPTAELRRIGEEYRTDVIERVKAGIQPPLADSTIERRNRRNKGEADVTPLIDTGTMLGSVSAVVTKK